MALKFDDIVVGNSLMCITSTSCNMPMGTPLEVKQNADGRLYVDCPEGEHYLENDIDAHRECPSFMLYPT